MLVAGSAGVSARRCLPTPADELRGSTHERLNDAGARWADERRVWGTTDEQNGGIVAASALKIGVSEMAAIGYEYSTGSALTTDMEILPTGFERLGISAVVADEEARGAGNGVSID